MSVLNNLTKKYLDEEKNKAKDKFTFIFQSEKDEDIDIKQLQTAKVYHVIDEPQFNENEGQTSKGHSRINSGLEHTIQGIKKYSTKGGSLHDRQFQKNQQTSEQQIQRQIQFEKKGKEIRDNMAQKKKDKVTQMKANSENKFNEQEKIAKSVIDIHKKGHLVYVDYGEDKNYGQNGVKELKASPKNSDLEAIAYSKIIKKTQEFLDQEERYEQIKRDLQFKFNFATDKNDHNPEQNKNGNTQNRQMKSISPISKNSNSSNIVSLMEGKIDVNISKDQKKKIDKDLFKYLKSESTNYLIERDNIASGGSIEKQSKEQNDDTLKALQRPPKILKNSHSAKHGKLGEKSTIFILKDNQSAVRLIDEENNSSELQFVDHPTPFEVCKTENDERQQVKIPLRNTRSQMANTLSRKQYNEQQQNQIQIQNQYQNEQYYSHQHQLQQQRQHSQKTLKQNQENNQQLQHLVSQKSKIQNKIAQQKIKFDQLLNQIQFVTNNKDQSVSTSIDKKQAKIQNQSDQVEVQLVNDRKKVIENQLSVNMEYPQNINSNQSMHGVKLPSINNNAVNHNSQIANYNRYLNQENIPAQKLAQSQVNQKNRYYSTGNSAQKSYINEQNLSFIQNTESSIYNIADSKQSKISPQQSRDVSRRGVSQNVKSKDNSTRINKDFSLLDQSITSITDVSYIKFNDSKQQKSEQNPSRKIRSHKSLHLNQEQNQQNNLQKQKSSIDNNNNKIVKQKFSLEYQRSTDIQKPPINNKQKSSNENKIYILNENYESQNGKHDPKHHQNTSQIEPSPILKNASPMIGQDLSGMSFMYSQESNLNLQDNSQILKQLQEQHSDVLKNNPSSSKLSESQMDRKKARSKTLHDAEVLLNRIKKRSIHYQVHQEQINNQIQNFNFDKVKQRQIKILQTFKDQKVPDIVKKRLHHDFIDILSMCKS